MPARCDLLIKNGTVVDGTGARRFVGDVAISQGKIVGVGDLSETKAERVIDAEGCIVAPGVIDLHTHYDAQIAWDPYCRSSGWHGTTTAVVGNCGFGFAPCRPDAGSRERYMRMMENTEQISYKAMAVALPWTWESYPDWLEWVRSLPKGLNIASYLPMNALLSYVVGPDEAKKRPATEAEREKMRDLLNEAMDAGASGFAFSHLGADGNSHVDYDFTAMPADLMDYEEAYNLARVLRDRGEGAIQALIEIQGMDLRRTEADRVFLQKLARISGRPVLHNMTSADPGGPEYHRSIMRWLDDSAREGLSLYSQAFSFRTWLQMRVLEFNAWDSIPIFREFSAKAVSDKAALASDPDYRRRLKAQYKREEMGAAAGPLEGYVLLRAPHAPQFEDYIGWTIERIAASLDQAVTDTFFDIVAATKLEGEFRVPVVDNNADYIAELLRHPRIICGASDGGAHVKFFSGGHFSTDMLVWLVREQKQFSLEEMHHILSAKPAEVFGLRDRGTITVGQAADIMIYDFEALGFAFGHYQRFTDLPGDDWGLAVEPQGIRYTIVNGEVTHEDGAPTGRRPGEVISNAARRRQAIEAHA